MDGMWLCSPYFIALKLNDTNNFHCLPLHRYSLDASLDMALSEQLVKRKLFVGQKLRVICYFHFSRGHGLSYYFLTSNMFNLSILADMGSFFMRLVWTCVVSRGLPDA